MVVPFARSLLHSLVSIGLLLVPPVAAQVQPPRTDYVFHVYVDPIYGDNSVAIVQNPGVTGMPVPLALHPDTITVPQPIGGVLQHAPYPFRTLTGQTGVRGYLDTVFPNGLPRGFGPGLTVKWVVIHCLPGLYGKRFGTSPPNIDPASGMLYNGARQAR